MIQNGVAISGTIYREMVLGEVPSPTDFGEAQRRHIALNSEDINLWDA